MDLSRAIAIARERKSKRAAKRALLGLRSRPTVKRPPGQRKDIVKKLDAMFSFYVRLRDKRAYGVCRICRQRPVEVCYHFIPRGSYATRWDPENACGACSPCNMGEKWHRLKYREKHIEILGALKYAELESKARTIAKFSNDDLIRMEREFANLCGRLPL